MDWLQLQDNVWTKWLGRVVATIALYVGYQVLFSSSGAPKLQHTPGVTLQKDWKSKRIEALEQRLAELEVNKEADDDMYEEDDVEIESEEEEGFVEVDPKEAKDMLNNYKQQVMEANAEKEAERKKAEEALAELEEEEAPEEEEEEEEPVEEEPRGGGAQSRE